MTLIATLIAMTLTPAHAEDAENEADATQASETEAADVRWSDLHTKAGRAKSDPDSPKTTYKHGVRIGAVMLPDENQAYSTMGYEAMQFIDGNASFTLVFVENIMLTGAETGMVLPSINGLVGAAIQQRLTAGVGLSASSVSGLGVIGAVGYIADTGSFDLPLAVSYQTAPEGVGRVAFTAGVNW